MPPSPPGLLHMATSLKPWNKNTRESATFRFLYLVVIFAFSTCILLEFITPQIRGKNLNLI